PPPSSAPGRKSRGFDLDLPEPSIPPPLDDFGRSGDLDDDFALPEPRLRGAPLNAAPAAPAAFGEVDLGGGADDVGMEAPLELGGLSQELTLVMPERPVIGEAPPASAPARPSQASPRAPQARPAAGAAKPARKVPKGLLAF